MKIEGKTAAEIFDSVRLMTQSSQLLPGDGLPPVRDLAVELDVNRNTVAAAYKRLVASGIAVSQGRLGTLIRQPERLGEQEGVIPGSPLTDIASGNPNPQWLPDVGELLARRPYRKRLYGEPTVCPELQDWARDWLQPDLPGHCEIDLTHGAVDGIERLLAGELVNGDKVAVENPCFLSSINTLRIAGLTPIGVPVDEEGLCAQALARLLAKGVQAVIITPRAHNPTGFSLSKQRAQALREVLAPYPHVLIIVDDHFALLSAQPYYSPIPDTARRWALIRSMSKVLGPDMRLAMVGADRQTSQHLRLRLASGTNWVSHLLQDVVYTALSSTDFQKRIEQARHDYVRRRDLLNDALSEAGVEAAQPCDGLNLWLPLRTDPQTLSHALARRGWLVRGSEVFCVDERVAGLRLTTSCLEADDAKRLAHDIAACL